jgi:hypothetical protein
MFVAFAKETLLFIIKDWTFSKIKSIIFSKRMLMLKLDFDRSCVFHSLGAVGQDVRGWAVRR